MYPVDIRELPSRSLVTTEHSGPYPNINHAFERLFATLAARHLIGHTGYMVGVFLHDPSVTPVPELRSYAGAVIETPFDIPAPLHRHVLPAGPHAVLTYQGPYAGLPAAYDQLFGLWLPESGRQMADRPSFEVYLNSPMDTAQDKLLTELHLPLA